MDTFPGDILQSNASEEPKYHQTDYSTDCSKSKPLPLPLCPKEALLREIEIERIKVEIAMEIAQKKKLEEIIDELKLKAMIRKELIDALCLSYSNTLSEIGSSLFHVLEFPEQRWEELPFQRHPDAEMKKSESVADFSSDVNMANSSKFLTEDEKKSEKRKMQREINENPMAMKKMRKELSCALCEITTTSEQILNDHLNGKKHRAMLDKLRMSKSSIKIGSGLATKERNDSSCLTAKMDVSGFHCEDCKVSCNSKKMLATHLKGKKHAIHMSSDGGSTSTTTERKIGHKKTKEPKVVKEENGKPFKEKNRFQCEHCNIKCNSLSMLDDHLKGKKHLAQMQGLKKYRTYNGPRTVKPLVDHWKSGEAKNYSKVNEILEASRSVNEVKEGDRKLEKDICKNIPDCRPEITEMSVNTPTKPCKSPI